MICEEARRVAAWIEQGARVFAQKTTRAERGAMTWHMTNCSHCQGWLEKKCEEELAISKLLGVTPEESFKHYREMKTLAMQDRLDSEWSGGD